MRLAILSIAGLALFAVLAVPLLRNEVIVDSDLGRFHLPNRDFYQRCLQNGDDYSWCPGLFCGYFVHGEGQGGYDHPWHLLLYSTLPLVPAFNLEVFLNYPFLVAGTYLLLRRHSLRRDAALFGGLCFTFSGFTLPHYPHTNAIAIVAHMPWLLWAIDVLWCAESRRQLALAQLVIGLATGSQILLGYPQYVWFSVLAEGLYVLVMLREQRRWSRFGLFVLAKCLGLLIGSAQLLPSLEALRDSPRMEYSKEFRGTFSLHPAQLLQLIAPTAFNESNQLHEYTVFAGMFLSLALVWLMARPGIARGRLAQWSLLVAIVCIPLALGKYTPLFRIYLKLPVVGVFRCPCRYLVLVLFAAAVFAALVANRLAEYARNTRSMRWPRLAWLALLPAAAWLLVFTMSGIFDWCGPELSPFRDSGWSPVRNALVFTLTAILFALAARGWSFALTALCLVSLAGQSYCGFRSIWTLSGPGNMYPIYRRADLATYESKEVQPPGPPHGRVHLNDVYGNALNMLNWPLTNGYVGLTPPRQLDYSKQETQQLAGTVWRHDGAIWQHVEGSPPRLRLVCEARASGDPQSDLLKIDPSKIVLLERDIEIPAGEPGSATIAIDRPGHVEVLCSMLSPQILVFTESYHQAWQVAIDGQPAELLRAYGDFQACVVPAGEHRVVFQFKPTSVIWGRRLSWLGLSLAFAMALVNLKFYGNHKARVSPWP